MEVEIEEKGHLVKFKLLASGCDVTCILWHKNNVYDNVNHHH